MVCQLARRSGWRVIAVAGGEAKCKWLMEEIGCDAALNYKDFRGASRAKDFTRAVREACKKLAGSGGERAGKKDRVPKIDIYFDNVGGWMLCCFACEILVWWWHAA